MAKFIKFTQKNVQASGTSEQVILINTDLIAKAVWDQASRKLTVQLNTPKPNDGRGAGGHYQSFELEGEEAAEALEVLQNL